MIELTLTTIYELDKLLHLLRDRSENLELLSVRLTWEENRIGSWKDCRRIINDLNVFLTKRARWSPSIYDPSPMAEDVTMPSRRASVTSLASIGSDTTISVPSFSRSARFKLAELLSRDAAQFGGRITSLRHGKVAAAGKALDKLIDNSRKPVPEVLLDEQDHLEEKSINEMEHVGKFVMNLVMQWRKYIQFTYNRIHVAECYNAGLMKFMLRRKKINSQLKICWKRSRRPNFSFLPHARAHHSPVARTQS